MVIAVSNQAEERVLLQNINWQFFEYLLEHLGENRSVRLAYDRGVLELMSPLMLHESSKRLIEKLIDVMLEEMEINAKSVGSMTCKREDLDRGAEPDTSYYIQNELLVRDKDRVNLAEDPPPDLVLEVEYSSSDIDKLQLYAALGVPEFWRYDGNQLSIYRLVGDKYLQQTTSVIFVGIALGELPRFLQEQRNIGEIPMIKAFRTWLREQI